MAVPQGDVLQQPPGAAQPERAPTPGPTAHSGSNNVAPAQAPATPAAPMSPGPQAPQGSAAEGQAQSPDQSFSQILEQQIAQAIQPVLDEFRQQMAQEVAQQTAATPSSGSSGQQPGQAPLQGQGPQAPVQQPQQAQPPPTQQAPVQPPAPQAAVQQVAGQVTQQAPVPQVQQAAQAASPAQPGTQPATPEQPLTGALAPAVRAVERHGEHWLQSLLVAGLGALLAESTHAAVQQRAEQGLHALLQKLFEAAPNGVSNQEMQRKTEGTLQLILRESLDAVFTQGMRGTVQQGGQQAIQQSLRGDFGSAIQKVQDMLRAMADALLAVLARHRQTVLRLMLALALLALESSLLQPEKGK